MDNNNELNKCFECDYYKSLYEKTPSRFTRSKYGKCSVFWTVKKNSERCCEKFKKRGACGGCRSRKGAIRVLGDILLQISEIRQIFEEKGVIEFD